MCECTVSFGGVDKVSEEKFSTLNQAQESDTHKVPGQFTEIKNTDTTNIKDTSKISGHSHEIKKEKNVQQVESVEKKDLDEALQDIEVKPSQAQDKTNQSNEPPNEFEMKAASVDKVFESGQGEEDSTPKKIVLIQAMDVNDCDKDSNNSDNMRNLQAKVNGAKKDTEDEDDIRVKSKITHGRKKQAQMTSSFKLPGQPEEGQAVKESDTHQVPGQFTEIKNTNTTYTTNIKGTSKISGNSHEIKKEKNIQKVESVENKDLDQAPQDIEVKPSQAQDKTNQSNEPPNDFEMKAATVDKVLESGHGEENSTPKKIDLIQAMDVNNCDKDSKNSDKMRNLQAKVNVAENDTEDEDDIGVKFKITHGRKTQAQMTSSFKLPGQPEEGQAAASNLTAAEFTKMQRNKVSSLKFPCFFQKLGEKVISNLIIILVLLNFDNCSR